MNYYIHKSKSNDIMNSFHRRYHTKITFLSFSVPFILVRNLESIPALYLVYYLRMVFGFPSYFIMIYFSIFLFIRFLVALLQPLMGYVSDRNYLFTRKLGRRFIWIMISGLITLIFFILYFLPIITGISVSLFYFFAVIFLFYIFLSLYSTSYSALLLNKFRNYKERLIIAAITESLSIIGFLIFSFVLPYSLANFLTFIIIPVAIFLGSILLGIPGLLEEKELIDTYFSPNQKSQEWFFKDFFKRFYITFRQKNFLLLLFRWIAISTFSFFFLMLIPYHFSESMSPFLIFCTVIAYYGGYLLSIPLSFVFSRLYGYLKIWIISGFAMGIVTILFPFIGVSHIPVLIFMAILGFTYGFGSVPFIPLMGDICDESAVINHTRSEGFFFGVLNLFGSLIYLISQSPIRMNIFLLNDLDFAVLISFIPGIGILITMILFLRFYDLRPQRVKSNQDQLIQLQI